MTAGAPGDAPAAVRHLLLYGTLQRGWPAHAALGLDRALALVGHRWIEGTLLDLGAYPGLVAGPGRVRAELHRLLDPSVLPALDRHEGWTPAAPDRALFRRERRRVPGAPGEGDVDAWLYVYARPPGDAPRVPGGIWPPPRQT